MADPTVQAHIASLAAGTWTNLALPVEKFEIAKRIHPLYKESVDDWVFWRETYEGGKGYTRKYLEGHRVEGPEDFLKRQHRSYFLNYTASVVDIYTNAIFRAKVVRQDATSNGSLFLEDITGRHVSPDAFWKRVSTYTATQGKTYILIDTPRASQGLLPKVMTGVADGSRRPFLKLVTAEALVDWSLDEHGNFNWALLRMTETRDEDPYRQRFQRPVYILLKKGIWEVYDEKTNFLRGGIFRVPVVPLVTAYQVDFDEDERGESLIKDIADLNKAIFNWCSLLDEILYLQTFGQLVVAADEEEMNQRVMGTSRTFNVPKDTPFPPLFISPDASQAGIFIQWIGKAVKELFRLGFARKSGVEDVEQYATAQGKLIDLFDLHQALANKAQALQEAETKTAEIVGQYFGDKEPPYKAIYPEHFDLRTLEADIENYTGLKSLDFGAEFNFETAKKVVMKALPYLKGTQLDKLLEGVHDKIQQADAKPDFTVPPVEPTKEGQPEQ